MATTPRTAAAVRLQLLAAARAAEGASVPEEARWAVIRDMEQAWNEQPTKVRAWNRKMVLSYLFGFGSTKLLSDAYIIALQAHLEDFDALSELRLCLRAAQEVAGQLELGE